MVGVPMTARLSAGLLAHLVARVLFHLNPRVFTHAQLDHLSDGGEPEDRGDEEEHPQTTQRTTQEPTGDLELAARGRRGDESCHDRSLCPEVGACQRGLADTDERGSMISSKNGAKG
jgi:hypothetical protein